MGQTSSRGNASTSSSNGTKNEKTLEIVVDQGVREQIKKLTGYVSSFNDNDVNSLLNVVKEYQNELNKGSEQKYDLSKIEKFVGSFHKELLDQISKDNNTLSNAGKQSQLKEKLKNTSNLPDYLKSIYSESLTDVKEELFKSPVVQNDKEIKDGITNLFDDITGLKSKYKFFEYRYIQLNLFLIIFIQHTFTSVNTFVDSVLQYTTERDKNRQDNLTEIIKLLLKIMSDARINIEETDFDLLNKLTESTQQQLAQREKDLKDNLELAADGVQQKMAAVLNVNPALAPMTSSTNNPLNQFNGQQGGFVRDNSVFPQSFYELCTK